MTRGGFPLWSGAPTADTNHVSGTGTLSTAIHRDLHTLERDVQGSLLQFVGLANRLETRHRRLALARELAAHLANERETAEC
jgi:hypothetical protein